MLQYFGPRSVASAKEEPRFTYTGQYAYLAQTGGDGTVHFDLALLTSGTLRFTRKPVKTAVFLQAGGEKGTDGNSTSQAAGGNGGRHLETEIQLNAGTSYNVVIGGSGEATTAFGLSTEDADGVDGSLGGKSGTNTGVKGRDGVTAFDGTSLIQALNGRKYGAGGGAGAFRSAQTETIWVVAGHGAGGSDGGGRGGYGSPVPGWDTMTKPSAGSDNTGSGGGAGYGDKIFNVRAAGASGGSGILLIRDIR